MNCIIVDDEPVARKGMKSLVEQIPQLTLVSTHCMAVPFSFLSRGYRESLHQKNYYSLLLLIGNSDI